jgi:hypothetical protein
MLSQALAYYVPGLPEIMLVFLISGFWLLLIILPILYVVHSIKVRRKILTEMERLAAEVCSLRQQVEAGQKPDG